MVDVPEVRVQAGGQEGCPFPLLAKRKKNADELVMQDTVHNVSKKGKHHMNVIEMLEESDGHEIVQALRRRDGCTAKTRCKMVRILVSGMIKLHGSRPPTEIKTGLAKAIVETFPFLRDSEGEGYEAFFTKSIGRHTATGYIEERLRNVRRRMPEASGSSNQKSKLRVEEEEVGESSESNTPSKDSIPEEHMNEMCRWLQHNIEPKSKVEEYTKETSRFRLHEIRKETSSFASIMGSWPRILDDPGMIEEDFSALIGQNKSDKLSKKWTKELAAQILQYCELQRSGVALGDVFQSLKTAEDPQVALQCLPLFLAPGRMRNTPGRFRNATHSEALNAFIDQQPVGTNLPRYLNEILEDERRQPFVLLLGERSRPAQAFVIFEGRAMAAPSLLKAIDLCFKMIYVFDVEYAPQCYTTWEFVQKYVFEISDNVKGKMGTSPSVRSLRAHLTNSNLPQ